MAEGSIPLSMSNGPTIDPYGGRAPALLGVSWSLFILSTALVALRTYSTLRLTKKDSTWALVWIWLSWLFGVATILLTTIAAHYGLGNHIKTVFLAGTLSNALIYMNVWTIFAVIQILLGKFSVVAFLLTIQGRTHIIQRVIMFGGLIVLTIASILVIFFLFFTCDPPAKLWHPLTPGTCPRIQATYIMSEVACGLSAAMDLYLALYPIVLVWRLQMERRLKIIVGLLMGLGVFTAVCAVLKAYYLAHEHNKIDVTYYNAITILWSNAEAFIVIIAASVPPCYPVFRACVPRISAAISSTRRYYSSDSRHSRSSKSPFSSQSGALRSGSSAQSPKPLVASAASPARSRSVGFEEVMREKAEDRSGYAHAPVVRVPAPAAAAAATTTTRGHGETFLATPNHSDIELRVSRDVTVAEEPMVMAQVARGEGGITASEMAQIVRELDGGLPGAATAATSSRASSARVDAGDVV